MLAKPGCQYTYMVTGDLHYKCHRETTPNSIYCKHHAIKYEIPQDAAEILPGVFE